MAPATLGRMFGGARSGRATRKGIGHEKAQRALRQHDPTRPCPMAKLSEDLILQVFEFVQAGSPQSPANLALVHPRFYRQARYVQHRRVTIDLDNRHEVAVKHMELMFEENLLSAIQELRVFSRFHNPKTHCLQMLADVVAGMTGLRVVDWEYSPIPTTVLESLRQLSSQVRLHVVVMDRNSRDPAARQLLASLAGYEALISLTIDAAYLKATDCLELSQPLRQLLLTCPKLSNFSVDLHLPRQGCIGFAPPFEYPGLGFSNGEHPLRPLESLSVHEYPWGEKPLHGQFAFHSQGYPCPGQEIDYWAMNFDWSQLRRLEATSPATQVLLANTLAPMLKSLRDVHFTLARDLRGNSLETFFDQVPSVLEAISVPSLNSIGSVAFSRHASTLRKLAVHQLDQSSDLNIWTANLLSEKDIEDLLEKAPQLEELSIDTMRVDGDWPHTKLNTLARFPRLRLLELWFSFGDWTVFGAPQPHLTASSAAQLFAGVRRACPTLRELRVHSGCAALPRLGFLADSSSYTGDNAASFSCSIPERDDEAAAGKVAVTSLRLSPRLNARMQRILKGQEKREDIQGNLIALRVALDGPLKYADWKRWKEEWPIPNYHTLMDAAEGWHIDAKQNQSSRSRLSRIWRR